MEINKNNKSATREAGQSIVYRINGCPGYRMLANIDSSKFLVYSKIGDQIGFSFSMIKAIALAKAHYADANKYAAALKDCEFGTEKTAENYLALLKRVEKLDAQRKEYYDRAIAAEALVRKAEQLLDMPTSDWSK